VTARRADAVAPSSGGSNSISPSGAVGIAITAVNPEIARRAGELLGVTGLPGLSMRFGTSKDGMPIGVQIVGSWQAEPTILHVAALLEQLSPVRDLHPNL